MNTQQINSILFSSPLTKDIYVGTFPCDRIPGLKKRGKRYAMVVNTDRHTKKGSHWIVIYSSGKKNDVNYFCSYGGEPFNKYIYDFLPNLFTHSGRRVQALFSANCGQHCIYFISKRAGGMSYENIMKTYSHSNFEQNDKMVERFCEKNFSFKINKQKENLFMHDQISNQIIKNFKHISSLKKVLLGQSTITT